MDPAQFKESLQQASPPAGVSACLQALWYEAKGDWKRAHDVVESRTGGDAAWVHAYLHRKEGDLWNADYWYARAGRKRPAASLQEEWNALAAEFCARADQ